jgi:hypothetical protein
MLLPLAAGGHSAGRFVEYHHLGDEGFDVPDMRQTAIFGQTAKVLVDIVLIIRLVIILRKEF